MVSGCDHVHPVSITTLLDVNLSVKGCAVHFIASIKLSETVLFPFMLHEGCVGFHRSTQTQDRPFHRE